MVADLEMMIEPVVTGLGCDFWGLEQAVQGSNTRLKVYIDAIEGVTVDDCARISRQISSVFDVEDPIPGHYTLEVSSPGMDRILFRLEQFGAYIGETIKVTLKIPYDGQKNFRGVLVRIEGDEVVIRLNDEELLLPYETIHRAKLVPNFNAEEKPVH